MGAENKELHEASPQPFICEVTHQSIVKWIFFMKKFLNSSLHNEKAERKKKVKENINGYKLVSVETEQRTFILKNHLACGCPDR